MKGNRKMMMLGVMLVGSWLSFLSCSPQKAEPVRTGTIADGELDPAKWGQVYPLEYDQWKKTADPKPVGKSKYKRGFDTDNVRAKGRPTPVITPRVSDPFNSHRLRDSNSGFQRQVELHKVNPVGIFRIELLWLRTLPIKSE